MKEYASAYGMTQTLLRMSETGLRSIFLMSALETHFLCSRTAVCGASLCFRILASAVEIRPFKFIRSHHHHLCRASGCLCGKRKQAHMVPVLRSPFVSARDGRNHILYFSSWPSDATIRMLNVLLRENNDSIVWMSGKSLERVYISTCLNNVAYIC